MLMCLAKKFLKKEKTQQHYSTIIMNGLSMESSKDNIPTKVRRMLTEFKQILVDEIPTGLPATRSISHQIDLIPGSSLPNKATHRMKLIENVELN